MEELGTILRTVCLGLCVCGLGIVGLVAVFLGFTGGSIITAVKDILGVGQRDEDDVIDEAMSSIQRNRQVLKTKRKNIVGDGGIPDFDAAVAKYSQNSNNPIDDSFSTQSADKPEIGGLGSGNRFNNQTGGIRGKRRSNYDREYERDDDEEDFFDG